MFTLYFFGCVLIVSLLYVCLPVAPSVASILTNNLKGPLFFPMCATWSTHLLHLNLITIDFGHLSRHMTRLRTGLPRIVVRFPPGQEISHISKIFTLLLGPTQPTNQWTLTALSPGIKRSDRKADHRPSSNAEVKNAGSCTSTFPCCFVACARYLHMHRQSVH